MSLEALEYCHSILMIEIYDAIIKNDLIKAKSLLKIMNETLPKELRVNLDA